MDSFVEFIKTNPIQFAIIVLLLLAYILYKIWQIKKKGLRPTIIDFIVKAEENFKQGENDEKMNFVIDKIITLIPLPFSLLITRSAVRNIIQNVFDEIKKALDYYEVPEIGDEE